MPHVEYKGGGSSRVRVEEEREAAHGWEFILAVRGAAGGSSESESRHTVTLSYRDHDVWSGGRMSPSNVVEQVVAYVVRRRQGEPLPTRFDAARVRYWFPEFDQEMRSGAVG